MKLKLYYADGGMHPVVGQVYYKRQNIYGQGDSSRYQRYLANTLVNLAPDVESCSQVLSCISAVERGELPSAEIEGNEVDMELSLGSVQIDININDEWIGNPEGRFSLGEIKLAFQAWGDFLKMPESFDSCVEIDLQG